MPAKKNTKKPSDSEEKQPLDGTAQADSAPKTAAKPKKRAAVKVKSKPAAAEAENQSEASPAAEDKNTKTAPAVKKRKISVRNKNKPKAAASESESPEKDSARENAGKPEPDQGSAPEAEKKESPSAPVLKEVQASYAEKDEAKEPDQPPKEDGGKITQKAEVVNEIQSDPKPEPADVKEPETIDNDEIEAAIRRRRSIRLYRKIALIFIALTLTLLAVIFYFSFVKVTITLVPNQERVSNSMIIDIIDRDQTRQPAVTSIRGAVKTIDIEYKKTYPATGAVVIGQEAVGKATIINNYDKNQPLVATTRLLTPDNKLFRISQTVNVPAGGSVTVDIYADKPGEDMAIGPTKFSIPGLWAGLQDKIFAESKESVEYRQRVKKHITDEDIDNSRRDLRQALLAEAKNEVSKTYENFSEIIYKIDENTIKSSVQARVGEEKEEFSATMQAKVAVVAFNSQDAALLAKQKFLASLADNKDLITFNEDDIIYTLDNYNHSEGEATISATFEGRISLKENTDIVELEKILGLNEEQLNTYLRGLPEIAGFEVKFFPVFVKRVPKLIDRIDVVVKK